jgi:hypothetical protein
MSAITFSCTSCGQVLQVPGDKAGRKAKCAQCGAVLTIPAAAAVAEGVAPRGEIGRGAAESPPKRRFDEELEAVPERPRRRHGEDGDYDVSRRLTSPWEKVRLGFLIGFIGLCVMAGAHGLHVLGALLGLLQAWTVATVFHRIAACVVFMGTIGAIVGHVFCLFVPNKRSALAFAIATLAVAGVYLLMQIVYLAMLFNPFRGNYAVMLLTQLLQAAHFMMIAFFLRALAQLFDAYALEKNSMLLIILSGCYAGYALISGIIIMALPYGTGLAIVIGIVGLLGVVLVAVLYVFTLLAFFRCKALADRWAP